MTGQGGFGAKGGGPASLRDPRSADPNAPARDEASRSGTRARVRYCRDPARGSGLPRGYDPALLDAPIRLLIIAESGSILAEARASFDNPCFAIDATDQISELVASAEARWWACVHESYLVQLGDTPDAELSLISQLSAEDPNAWIGAFDASTTAQRAKAALRAGAVDHLPYPFVGNEGHIVAGKVLLRRETPAKFGDGALVVDLDLQRVRVGSSAFYLGRVEFRVVRRLCLAYQRPVDESVLRRAAGHGDADVGGSRATYRLLRRFGKKLGPWGHLLINEGSSWRFLVHPIV